VLKQDGTLALGGREGTGLAICCDVLQYVDGLCLERREEGAMAKRFRVRTDPRARRRRLGQGVAALGAAGALTAAPSAEAVPVYFDPVDQTINPPSGEDPSPHLNLNLSALLNPSAVPDAVINYGFQDPSDPAKPPTLFLQFQSLNNSAEAIQDPVPHLAPIGPGQSYVRSFNLGFNNLPEPGIDLGFSTPAAGDMPWVGAGNVFLGMMVDIPGGSPHFGWVQLSVGTDLSVTLYDYAMESDPDTAIRAGQIEPVPESGTLGLLALGAAGLAAWRRARGRA